MKFPPDFHNYTGLNGLANSFSQFTMTLSNGFQAASLTNLQKGKETTLNFKFKERPEHWCFSNIHSQMLYKAGTLEEFTKFTGKYLCRGLFFNKVQKQSLALFADPQACNFIKNRHLHRCFSMNFEKFVKTPF